MHERLGHYRVLEQIGSGGMGVVYLARDERLERNVAIKVLPPDSLADDDARRRFRREALALSRLNHPNVATIHDFDTFGTVDVLVMEHIPGTSLDEAIERAGPLPEAEIIRLAGQLAAALEAAHAEGVVHRDLKPGNIRITPDGRLKVLDFGLARALRAEPDATTASLTGSTFAGTLPYMAPEQLKGEPVDPRTDIYAAGAVLYEMATGARVHGDLGGARLLGAILDSQAPPARKTNPRISPELDRIISKALDKDAGLRYQSARELAVDLHRLETGTAAPRREKRGLPRRRPVATAALASIAVVVVAFTGWMTYREWPWKKAVVPRGSIAIADFTDATGDTGLGDAIRAGLSVQLQQSQYGDVVSREQIFDALRRMQKSSSSLDADTLRELCIREGIPVLLAGAVQRRGDVTRVEARAIATATGDVLFAENVQFRQDSEAFASIDTLARLVRRQLGESMVGIEERSAPLAQVTTRSLAALKQYSRATDEFARGNADAALSSLRAALDVDHDFAMAHRLIARVYETLGDSVKEREHLARAYELRASLTERERRHVEGSYYRGNGEYEKAVETLGALTALYPRDGEAHYELAIAYRDAGSRAKAVSELETIIAERPYVSVAYGELLLLLCRLSDYTRAREVYGDALRRGIADPRITWAYGMLLLGEGRSADARAQFVALEARGDVFAGTARLYQTTIDTYEGKFGSATEKLEQDILLDRKGRGTAAELKRRELLARLALLRNDRAEVRRQVNLVLAKIADGPGAEEPLRRAAALLALIGDVHGARPLVARLARLRDSLGSAFAQSCHDAALGELSLAEGQTERAIDAFRQADAEYWRPMTTQGLARAYAAAGDWTRAREQWSKFIGSRGEIFHQGFAADWVLGYLELARAEQHAGDIAAARRHYETFLALWRGGDDVPARRRATEEQRSLAAFSAGTPASR